MHRLSIRYATHKYEQLYAQPHCDLKIPKDMIMALDRKESA